MLDISFVCLDLPFTLHCLPHSVKLIHMACLMVLLFSGFLLVFISGRHQQKIRGQEESEVWIGYIFSCNPFYWVAKSLAAALWVTSPGSGNYSALWALGGVPLPDVAILSVLTICFLIHFLSLCTLSLFNWSGLTCLFRTVIFLNTKKIVLVLRMCL